MQQTEDTTVFEKEDYTVRWGLHPNDFVQKTNKA